MGLTIKCLKIVHFLPKLNISILLFLIGEQPQIFFSEKLIDIGKNYRICFEWCLVEDDRTINKETKILF